MTGEGGARHGATPRLQTLCLPLLPAIAAAGLEALAPSLAQCTRLDLTGCTSLSRVLLPDSPLLQSVR